MTAKYEQETRAALGLTDTSLLSGTFWLKTISPEVFEKNASGIFQAFRYLAIIGGLNEAWIEYTNDKKDQYYDKVNAQLSDCFKDSCAAHFGPFMFYAIKSMVLDIVIDLYKGDPWKSLKKAANLALILATFKAFAVAAPFMFIGITLATFAHGYHKRYKEGVENGDFNKGEYIKAFSKCALAATSGSLMSIVSLFVLPAFAIGGAAALGVSIAGSTLQTTFGTAKAFYDYSNSSKNKESGSKLERGPLIKDEKLDKDEISNDYGEFYPLCEQ